MCSVGLNSSSVKLYDLRSFDKGPFVTFPVEKSREELAAGSEWTGLKFSPDGRSILIQSNSPHLRLLDAYLGALNDSTLFIFLYTVCIYESTRTI